MYVHQMFRSLGCELPYRGREGRASNRTPDRGCIDGSAVSRLRIDGRAHQRGLELTHVAVPRMAGKLGDRQLFEIARPVIQAHALE